MTNLIFPLYPSNVAAIHSVSCAGSPAEFSLHDHLTHAGLSDPRDVHLYPELKRKIYAASNDGQGGELSISLPSQVRIEPVRSMLVSTAAADALDAPTPGGTSYPGTELAPITLRIDYSLTNPVDAVHCARPSPEFPWRQPHMYVSPTCPDYARCWVPCVDTLWERNTWEFQFIVPRSLAVDGPPADDGKEAQVQDGDGQDVLVACTGDLVEQVSGPCSSSSGVLSKHPMRLPRTCLRPTLSLRLSIRIIRARSSLASCKQRRPLSSTLPLLPASFRYSTWWKERRRAPRQARRSLLQKTGVSFKC